MSLARIILLLLVVLGHGAAGEPAPAVPAAPPLEPGREALAVSRAIVRVARVVCPSVVSIHTERFVEAPSPQDLPGGDLFPDDAPEAAPPPGVRRTMRQRGLGSGVIVSRDGVVLTNNHIVADTSAVQVSLPDNRSFDAVVVGADAPSDLAVLRIQSPPADLPAARLGDSDALEVGEIVVAVGSPFAFAGTVTQGIVSAKGRTMGVNDYEDYLQTDAAINPGNSGGALANLAGEVVGINTAIATRTGWGSGVGFAIPARQAKRTMEELLRTGGVTRGFLGIVPQDLDRALAGHLGLAEPGGVLVARVLEGTPAARAGLRAKDVIVRMAGAAVRDQNHLRDLVAGVKPDEACPLVVLRERREVPLSVAMARREEAPAADRPGAAPPPRKGHGLRFLPAADTEAGRFHTGANEGLVVADVEAGSAGDRAGFRPGDLVLEAAERPVKTRQDFEAALRAAPEALVLVDRQGRQSYLLLRTGSGGAGQPAPPPAAGGR